MWSAWKPQHTTKGVLESPNTQHNLQHTGYPGTPGDKQMKCLPAGRLLPLYSRPTKAGAQGAASRSPWVAFAL
eukprot:1159840-Pelagomonas_calceolata.AAC.15